MAHLKHADMVALSRRTGDRLDVNSREVFEDPLSRERLHEAGLIDEKGVLTKVGQTVAEQLEAQIEVLKAGVPIEKRKGISERRAWTSPRPWYLLKAKALTLYTNGDLLGVGDPPKEIEETVPMPDDIKAKMPRMLQRYLSICTLEMFPHSYQLESLGGFEYVWLADASQEKMIPIQAKYFDYFMLRYPKAHFFAGGAEDAIACKVKNRGIKDVVALVMPFRVVGVRPQPRKGWKPNGEAEV